MYHDIDPTGSEGAQQLFLVAQRHAAHARLVVQGSPTGVLPTEEERAATAACLIHCAESALDWIHWAFLATRIPLPSATGLPVWQALVEPWCRTPTVARATGRSDQFRLNRPHATLLTDLGAWHSLLRYGNEQCENRLHRRLRGLGVLDGRQAVRHALTAEVATRAISETAALFEWARVKTGLPAPEIDHAFEVAPRVLAGLRHEPPFEGLPVPA